MRNNKLTTENEHVLVKIRARARYENTGDLRSGTNNTIIWY